MENGVKAAWVCSRCLRVVGRRTLTNAHPNVSLLRTFTSPPPLRSDQAPKENEVEDIEQGAMSRRLSEMAEETIDTGSKSDRKMMQDAGFSEDLKTQLEERIAQTAFKVENQHAISQAELPSYAGKGTQQQAAAAPWTGNEPVEDAALRMLDDSYKKLRRPARKSSLPPPKISVRPPSKPKAVSAADRLASARERTSMYALSQQEDMNEEEREQFRKELKNRFSPGARPMPTSLQGLTSLANERIEDAIARGQFQNIQRGKGVNTERDYNANSPFLDTTEYFMNKIIQKQEIVPPWIEKQQELVKTVETFRARMRNDWRRHAARTIASRGGSLQDQVRTAQAFALAEEKANPRIVKVQRLSQIDSQGNLSTVTVEERISAGVVADQTSNTNQAMTTIKVTETAAEAAPKADSPLAAAPEPSPAILPMAYPFRDPAWEKTEHAYHTLAVSEINSLTRSYNLMAPKVAQKPYTTLERELNRCFADVAPGLADEIQRRATKAHVRIEIAGDKPGGILDDLVAGHQAKIRDEDYSRKGYGFKEFWRDLFRRKEVGANM